MDRSCWLGYLMVVALACDSEEPAVVPIPPGVVTASPNAPNVVTPDPAEAQEIPLAEPEVLLEQSHDGKRYVLFLRDEAAFAYQAGVDLGVAGEVEIFGCLESLDFRCAVAKAQHLGDIAEVAADGGWSWHVGVFEGDTMVASRSIVAIGRKSAEPGVGPSSMEVRDVDGDGRVEVIVTARLGTIHTLDAHAEFGSVTYVLDTPSLNVQARWTSYRVFTSDLGHDEDEATFSCSRDADFDAGLLISESCDGEEREVRCPYRVDSDTYVCPPGFADEFFVPSNEPRFQHIVGADAAEIERLYGSFGTRLDEVRAYALRSAEDDAAAEAVGAEPTPEVVAAAGTATAAAAAPNETAPAADAWMAVGSGPRVEPLAMKWARLPKAHRAQVRFGQTQDGRWMVMVDPSRSANVASSIARAFGVQPSPVESLSALMTPMLQEASVRLTLRADSGTESEGLCAITNGALVVALEGGRREERTFVVASEEDSGWAVSRFLQILPDRDRCYPRVIDAIPGSGIDSTAVQRSSITARPAGQSTFRVAGEPASRVFIVSVRDVAAAKSAIAIYRREGDCGIGDLLFFQAIPGVLDEYFFTFPQAADGPATLLVASWHPETEASSSGMRSWGVWSTELETSADAPRRMLWREELPSAPFVDSQHRADVSGSNDRALARCGSSCALMVRRRGSGPRTFYWDGQALTNTEPAREPAR